MPADDSFPRLRARTQRFSLGEPRTITVCDGGRRILFLRAAAGDDARTGLWRLDLPDSGELAGAVERPVVGPAADAELPPAERARRERLREGASGVVSYAADDAGGVAAFALGGRLHVVGVESGEVRVLSDSRACYDPRPDPTGRRVAYVDGRDLRVVGADGADDRVLAADDDPAVFWGRAEFAAAEEMDRVRGFWWAPDGRALLATRVDETPVEQWWIGDPSHPGAAPTAVRYPAAGTANAEVSLWLLPVDQGDDARREVRWDRSRYPYLARVSWPGTGAPLLAVVSRDQRALAVLSVDAETGETTTLTEDTDPHWVEPMPGVPTWAGERLVRIVDTADTRRLVVGDEPATAPELYVRGVVLASGEGVVFEASAADPTSVALYRWSPAGVEPLAPDVGIHRGVAAAGDTLVVKSATLDTDRRSTIVRRGQDEVALTSYAVSHPLRAEVRMLRLGPRGLAAGLVLPRGHRAGERLPVLVDPYGGPHAQRVLSSHDLWLEPQWLADQGYAVLVVDGRGTPGRDPAWERAVHLDFAGPVLEDQVDALHAACELEPDLDLSRVGIRGWSFGGWLAALAVLRRPDVFHAAVAGAPVTDWSLYDTFYTERYLGTPQEQPEVYRTQSLIDDAPNLSRPLLLIHGLADDNVVSAHTLRLSQRLTETGREHAVLPLTGVSHMTPQETIAENLLMLQVAFFDRHLRG